MLRRLAAQRRGPVIADDRAVEADAALTISWSGLVSSLPRRYRGCTAGDGRISPRWWGSTAKLDADWPL